MTLVLVRAPQENVAPQTGRTTEAVLVCEVEQKWTGDRPDLRVRMWRGAPVGAGGGAEVKWLVADSLSCPEQFFCSHLSSYAHFLREAGEDARSYCMTLDAPGVDYREGDTFARPDVVFALDRYDRCASWHWGLDVAARTPVKRIAQVAAICNPMPWDVRKPDGSPAYDLVISSIPWMIDEARAKGCRAEYMPLAFDARARVCGMGVKRDLDCIFVGTVGPNHKRRTELLAALSDIVTVLPPVFGRQYFATLARAKVVFNPHSEWSR